MKKKMETDHIVHVYETQKEKQRKEKLEELAKNNLKISVWMHFINSYMSI